MKLGSRHRLSERGAGGSALHRLLFVVAVTGIVMLSIPIPPRSAQFVWNLTASAPIGLYRIERESWNVGDRVAVLPSPRLAADLAASGILGDGKLLIKRVAASTGDKVCRQQQEVSINGHVVAKAKTVRSDGASLPAWYGCVTLDNEQVFLLGDTPGSYDGRYFGVTAAEDVLGAVSGLIVL